MVNNGQGGDGLGFRGGVVLLEGAPRLDSRPHLHSKVAGRSQQEAALRLNTKQNEREQLRKFVSTQTLCGQEGWHCRRARRTCLSKPWPSLEIVLHSCEILPVGPAVGAMGFCSNLCGLLALVVAIIFGYMQTVECPGMRANDSNLSFSKTFD